MLKPISIKNIKIDDFSMCYIINKKYVLIKNSKEGIFLASPCRYGDSDEEKIQNLIAHSITKYIGTIYFEKSTNELINELWDNPRIRKYYIKRDFRQFYGQLITQVNRRVYNRIKQMSKPLIDKIVTYINNELDKFMEDKSSDIITCTTEANRNRLFVLVPLNLDEDDVEILRENEKIRELIDSTLFLVNDVLRVRLTCIHYIQKYMRNPKLFMLCIKHVKKNWNIYIKDQRIDGLPKDVRKFFKKN